MCCRILPTMNHSSGLTALAACNCGRRQADREDPFSLAEANFKFYSEMEEECCGELEKIQIPVFTPQESG